MWKLILLHSKMISSILLCDNWTDNHTWNVRMGIIYREAWWGILSATAKKKTISVMIFNPCNVVIKRRSQTVCAVITPKTLQEDDEWLIPILSISVISKVAMFKICRLPFSVSCCMRTEITIVIIKYGPSYSSVYFYPILLIRNVC